MIEQILKNNLNNEQFEAANRVDTSSLIIAWAGSWKTRVLTYKIANLVFGKWIRPENILAVTFTNKASNEMKERLVQLGEEIALEGDFWKEDDFDQLIEETTAKPVNNISKSRLKWVGTFHSIFLKILKQEIENVDFGYDKNFGIYDQNESFSLLKEIINSEWLKDDIEPKEAKWKISNLKNSWTTPSKFASIANWDWEEKLTKIYQNYQKRLQESNMMDFDDLLLLTKLLFEQNDEILQKYRKKFNYILVDEAQDTNQIQFDIVRKLWEDGGNVTFIWDDFQSIYWRRWAVMENFLSLEKRWPNIQKFKLETNYRSKPHIVEAWNSIISQNEKQYLKNVKSDRNWDDRIRVFTFQDETEEASQVVELIKKIQSEKNFNWNDFAILYRTNAQSQPFEQLFIQEWIPYKIQGGFKFFERKEIKDIISYIRYIINPKDNIALKRIINIPPRKIWKTTIDKIEQFATDNEFSLTYVVENIDTLPVKLTSSASSSIKNFSTIIKFITSNISTFSPDEVIKNLIGSIKYKEYLIQTEWKEKAEEKMENIGQLINMATKYENNDKQSGYQLLEQFLEEISLMSDLEEESAEDTKAVKLMSIHGSKWLEFPVVFICWLEENIFPLSKARFEKDLLEEERRLMYVATTRAQDILFLSHANSRKKRWQTTFNQASRFLEEIPDDLVKYYDLSGGSTSTQKSSEFDVGDRVKHKIFGPWEIIEVWSELVIVKFDSPNHGIRKINSSFLTRI